MAFKNEGAFDASSADAVSHVSAKRPSAGFMMKSLVDSQGIALWFLWTFIPTGFAVNYTGQNPIVVFVINFVAIIPSSSLLAFGVDQSMMYVGDKVSAILSMSFG